MALKKIINSMFSLLNKLINFTLCIWAYIWGLVKHWTQAALARALCFGRRSRQCHLGQMVLIFFPMRLKICFRELLAQTCPRPFIRWTKPESELGIFPCSSRQAFLHWYFSLYFPPPCFFVSSLCVTFLSSNFHSHLIFCLFQTK